jgi:hypothetical protein
MKYRSKLAHELKKNVDELSAETFKKLLREKELFAINPSPD